MKMSKPSSNGHAGVRYGERVKQVRSYLEQARTEGKCSFSNDLVLCAIGTACQTGRDAAEHEYRHGSDIRQALTRAAETIMNLAKELE